MFYITGHRDEGFTFIEMLIALVIVVILTIISIPLFSSIIAAHKISSAAENLSSSLQLARSTAIMSNATVYVSFTTGTSWCYGINSGSSCNCVVAGNCGLGTVNAPSGQIPLSIAGFSNNTISFESTHGATNSSGSITIGNTGQLITITVSALGNQNICSTDISGYGTC